MHSKQKIQTARFSKAKTISSYLILGQYLMCSSFAYAGPGFFGNDGEPASKTTLTRPLNKPIYELQENSEASSSYFSVFQNAASSTFNWMHESALSGCDRFGRWIAEYAEDLPPAYFAKSLLEIDYANDELFWQGHFNHELEDIKTRPYLGLQERTQLKELQDIVWNGLLSPYAYAKGLRDLGKERSPSVLRNIRSEFHAELKENPEIVLQHFQKDLLKSLEEMHNKEQGSERALLAKFKKKLTYYRNTMNAFDYADTLAGILVRIEEHKGKLALSATQHEDLKGAFNDALHKTNKTEYLQIKEELKATLSTQKNSFPEAEEESQEKGLAFAKAEHMGASDSLSKFFDEDTSSSGSFSYPLSFAMGASTLVHRGVSFFLENPTQVITMGLAFQAAAVAAASSFALPQQSGNTNSRSRLGNDAANNGFFNHEDQGDRALQNQNFIDLASLSPTQGFMIEGAAANDASRIVGFAGDFNGDGLSDVIFGAPWASPKGRQKAGCAYIIYGKKGGYLAPLDLASFNATQGVIIQGAIKGDNFGSAVSFAGDFNGDGISDVIVGAPSVTDHRAAAGASYVIYGKKGGYPDPIDLNGLSTAQGLIIEGAAANDKSGSSVSFAGDFNDDNVSDVVIGVNPTFNIAGGSYVVYGKKGGYPTLTIDLFFLNANQQGVIIEGTASSHTGSSVSSAGDFNGDGISDVIVGAYWASVSPFSTPGSAYVIYGKKVGYPAPINLFLLNATQGVIIQGRQDYLYAGGSVSSAGDFNDDGIDDVMVGAGGAKYRGPNTGAVYVIYGKKGGYPAPIALGYSLSPDQGVVLQGAAADDGASRCFSAGDFNGDGISDVMVGASNARVKDRIKAGTSYVIYGKKGGYPASIDLNGLSAAQGIIIQGAAEGDGVGYSISLAGDFNGDGLSDVIVNAGDNPKARRNAGSCCVIYGNYSLSPPTNAPTNVPTDALTNAPTSMPTDAPTNAFTGAPTNASTSAPFNPTPVISAGVAAVFGTISVGLAIMYRDKIRNWISSREYTSIDEDINIESHGEGTVGQGRTYENY